MRVNTVVETNSLPVLKYLTRKGPGRLPVPNSALWNERSDDDLRRTRVLNASFERIGRAARSALTGLRGPA